MNEAERAALNQIRASLRAAGYREAEQWSTRLTSLTPEERTAFVGEEIARRGQRGANPVESATPQPRGPSSQLAVKLDELYAMIQRLPLTDRIEILRGLADTVGGPSTNPL